jgi:isoleucyl-tRNA synthetase
LRAEGLAREVVHVVQSHRRDAGLDVSDRIRLMLDGDVELLDAVRTHQEWVAREILALEITFTDLDGAEPVVVDGRPLKIGIAVA